jgi:uncharacterized protein (TIGR00156 family)
MKKQSFFPLLVVCLLAFGLAFASCDINSDQVGFTGQATAAGQYGYTGPGEGNGYGYTGPGVGNGYGFTGPAQTVTVAQAQTAYDKTPVIVRGNIAMALGGDNYLFRDASGEIVLKIGPKEWMNFGSTIGPSDAIEISGEVHRDYWQIHIHAKYIRKI